jgi:hypothetical protein
VFRGAMLDWGCPKPSHAPRNTPRSAALGVSRFSR